MEAGNTQFPFDAEFQKSLILLLTEDAQFASVVVPHLEARFFENEILAWAFSYGQQHKEKYEFFPSIAVLKQQVRQLDPKYQAMYHQALEQIEKASLADVAWMRDAVLDFVKRNIFVRTYHESRALYNSGKVEDAYDLMMQQMERLYRTAWQPVDEEWFFDDLPNRQNERLNTDPHKESIGTGLPALDHIMGGGPSIGELATIIAYSKCGKTTCLTNFGAAATRQFRRVAHFVFEGKRQRVSAKYDAIFMDEFYNNVKRGEFSGADTYRRAYEQYQMLRGNLVIRGYTEEWDYSVPDIHNDIKRWKRSHNWDPELLVVDYGDLIKGREKTYPNETEKQKAAFRDLKSLANRGYVVWTASQAQRPEKGAEDLVHVIRSRMIADCYEKVRVSDFLCSHNFTREEKRQQRSRLLAELYRENEADQVIELFCNFAKMTITQWDPDQHVLGYGQPQAQPPAPQQGVSV